MSNIVICVEELSKAYRLGQIGTGTLSHDLNVWWAKMRGKPNPMLRIGEEDYSNRDGETIWALKDLNFTVEQGEVLGIIGRNGAGKSTLLKILSRVTAPTSGHARAKGHIASLLEVGTGFHQELTGRENIYLNGAILGMNKREIQGKFEEIVAFAEIGQFIDTPVKRYSSGMYVRLAFAVAAHLEPEILLVDEVLAVGDAAFQKKCLGKMGNVAKEGRTVLFVSHNMVAIQSLCKRALYLKKGKLYEDGDSVSVINKYLTDGVDNANHLEWNDINTAPGNDLLRIHSIRLLDENNSLITKLSTRDEFSIEVSYWNLVEGAYLELVLHVNSQDGILLFISLDNLKEWQDRKHPKGLFISRCTIPGDILNDNNYIVSLHFQRGLQRNVFWAPDILSFQIGDSPETRGTGDFKWPGIIRPKLTWNKKLLSRL
jgi:lipopolysaccharide transport system ATP-binding protein